jgi:hypothetical protein
VDPDRPGLSDVKMIAIGRRPAAEVVARTEYRVFPGGMLAEAGIPTGEGWGKRVGKTLRRFDIDVRTGSIQFRDPTDSLGAMADELNELRDAARSLGKTADVFARTGVQPTGDGVALHCGANVILQLRYRKGAFDRPMSLYMFFGSAHSAPLVPRLACLEFRHPHARDDGLILHLVAEGDEFTMYRGMEAVDRPDAGEDRGALWLLPYDGADTLSLGRSAYECAGVRGAWLRADAVRPRHQSPPAAAPEADRWATARPSDLPRFKIKGGGGPNPGPNPGRADRMEHHQCVQDRWKGALHSALSPVNGLLKQRSLATVRLAPPAFRRLNKSLPIDLIGHPPAEGEDPLLRRAADIAVARFQMDDKRERELRKGWRKGWRKG